MRLIDRTAETASVLRTMNGRNIYSHGRATARREVSQIDGIILHQTAFVTLSLERMNYVIANYGVMWDGTVLFLRPLEAALNSVGTDRHAIDVEFVGDYANAHSIRHPSGGAIAAPPVAQIRAGRELVEHLRRERSVSKIFAHVQFTPKNCCGPHLWQNVGVWALGRGMQGIGRGAGPIPANWLSPSVAVAIP